MASKTFLLLCIVAVVLMISYAGEAAREMATHSNDAEKTEHVADNKVNGIEDAKYGPGRGGYPGGGYPGGGYPGGGYPGGGYPGRGGPGGYPGGRNSCRFGCCGRRDYYGGCQRCCPPHAL